MRPAFRMIWAGVLLPAYAALPDGASPVTLDPAEMARAWQAAKSGAITAPAATGADAWQAAMLQPEPELARMQLLVWLQQQNPLIPLAGHEQDYAAAVGLHRGALAGRSAACAALAAAYRSGFLGVLQLPVSEQKARWFEQRALIAENLPE